MIILCSNGLTSEALSSYVKIRVRSHRNAALVVTADYEYKENNHHIKRCVNELERIGLSVQLFDLDYQDSLALLDYDVVEFIGGNPYYFLYAIRKCDAQEIIKKIAKEKILIGWSAAVFVFGPTLNLVNCYSPEMNFLHLKDLRGLGLTKIEVLPHYSKYIRRFESFEERCQSYENQYGVNVLRINDGDGVIIDGDNVHICRTASNE